MLNDSFPKRCLWWLLACLLCAGAFARPAPSAVPLATIQARDLPPEARKTLALIKQGGPFPYAKDGVVFGNYEGLLPRQKRGYYHEYTVKTPHARNRGARRIITGGESAIASEYYYTDNHYVTFMRIQE